MSAKLINLRQKRKQLARGEQRKVADQNATLHGLPKAQKALDKAQAVKAARMLDGVKRDV